MVTTCCVPNCANKYTSKNSGIKFHRFPTNDELRERWISNLGLNRIPSKWFMVCSEHFIDEDYRSCSLGTYKMLKPGSVPSQNLFLLKRQMKSRFIINQRQVHNINKEATGGTLGGFVCENCIHNMVINCCVPQCHSTQVSSNIKFHKFPSNVTLIPKWVKAIKSGKKPSKYAKVCSLHFTEMDYKPTIYHGDTRRFLKDSSIPSQNLPKSKVGPAAGKDMKTQRRINVQDDTGVILQNGDVRRFLKITAIPDRNLPGAVSRRLSNKCNRLSPKLRGMVLNPEPSDVLSETVEIPSLEVSVKPSRETIPTTTNSSIQTYVQYEHQINVNKIPQSKMEPACFVPGCKTKYSEQPNIKFYSFPRNPTLARLWNLKIISGKTPSKSSLICSKHFRPEDYTTSATTGDIKILKRQAVPSQHLPKKQIKHLVLLADADIQEVPLVPLPIIVPKLEKYNVTTQTDIEVVYERFVQTDPAPIQTESMSFGELSSDDFYFFTGLTCSSFEELIEFIGIEKKSTKYTKDMSNYDQLILTLVKLRHKFDFKVLAKMYGINQDAVHEIFVLWVNVMSDQFRKTNMWGIRNKNESDYTAILHCSEIPCQSYNSELHAILKSEKKKRPTIKYLVATDESGMVIFCSNQLLGGSLTNRQVIIKSGILAKLMIGDKVLSECDFGIDDLTKPNGIIFHQLHECDDADKGRACLNRVATMTKKFGILKCVFPANLMPHAATIVYVTNMLVNFTDGFEDSEINNK